MMRIERLVIALALVGTTFACGDLGNDSTSPPLVIIDGQLSRASAAPEPAPASNVRVAVIWQTNGEFKSTHDVEVVPVFPSRFRLELRDPPPASTMAKGPFEADDTTVAPTQDSVA